MRIVYYFKLQQTPMFLWQIRHIVEELKTHGIDIEIYNPLTFDSIEQANEALLRQIKANNYDLFMTTVSESDLFITTLEEIKRIGIPTLLICFDNLTVPFFHKKIAPHFDLVWLTSIETKYLFDNWGCNSIFLPYAANPGLFKPLMGTSNRVLFIGTPYGSRCRMLNVLLRANIPVTLHANLNSCSSRSSNTLRSKHLIKDWRMLNAGFDMMRFPIGRRLAFGSLINKITKKSVLDVESKSLIINSSVDLNQMMSLYSSYDLSLSSVTNRHTGVLKKPVMIVNLRSFEIPAAGGCLFCLWNAELAGYFEDTKEAIYYHDDEDMVEKARFYLNPQNHSIIDRIKKNARYKAINEHSWYCRFSKVFEQLNIKYE